MLKMRKHTTWRSSYSENDHCLSLISSAYGFVVTSLLFLSTNRLPSFPFLSQERGHDTRICSLVSKEDCKCFASPLIKKLFYVKLILHLHLRKFIWIHESSYLKQKFIQIAFTLNSATLNGFNMKMIKKEKGKASKKVFSEFV